jgi:ribosomal protein S18 acetylase RimI-like enzyme
VISLLQSGLLKREVINMNSQNNKEELMMRPMEPEDISDVLEIDRKSIGKRRAPTYNNLITEELGGDLDLSLIGEIGGQVVGFVLARQIYIGEPPVEVGLIQILGVDPDYRGQGIASTLTSAIADLCRTRGLKALHVMVRQDDSQLQGFFKRQGFSSGILIDYSKKL